MYISPRLSPKGWHDLWHRHVHDHHTPTETIGPCSLIANRCPQDLCISILAWNSPESTQHCTTGFLRNTVLLVSIFVCVRNWWIVSAITLYLFNISLRSASYHIWVIDIRSYNKDSTITLSQSKQTLAVGVQLVPYI